MTERVKAQQALPMAQPGESLVSQALAAGATVDVVERLVAMAERQREDARRTAFNAAMATAQSEMLRVGADAMNPQTRSKYASYAALDRALRPIYTAHGFGLSFDTADGAADGMIRVTGTVSHRDGYQRTYHIDMPSDGKGAKGGDVMTKTHATGAAVTYGMRYLLKMAFNVAVGEDDNDGNLSPGRITPEQAGTLRRLIERTGTDLPAFLARGKVESLEAFPASLYQAAHKWLMDLDARMDAQ